MTPLCKVVLPFLSASLDKGARRVRNHYKTTYTYRLQLSRTQEGAFLFLITPIELNNLYYLGDLDKYSLILIGLCLLFSLVYHFCHPYPCLYFLDTHGWVMSYSHILSSKKPREYEKQNHRPSRLMGYSILDQCSQVTRCISPGSTSKIFIRNNG